MDIGAVDSLFGGISRSLLTAKKRASEVVQEWKSYCLEAAEDARETATASQSSEDTKQEFLENADFLQQEASAWSLVERVLCGENHLSLGRLSPDGMLSFRQRVANAINRDADLLMNLLAIWPQEESHLSYDTDRALQLVSWLEEISRLNQVSGRKERTLGVIEQAPLRWDDTRRITRLMKSSNETLVSEYDPDAPSRQHRAISAIDWEKQQALLKDVWDLIRKGDVKNAIRLCAKRGQPWRAATLAGSGSTGPIPMHLDAESHEHMAQEMVSDSHDKDGYLSWRHTCLEIARSSKLTFQGPGLNYEAAIHGSMCGDLASILPVCETWEDILWAHARCYLHLKAEQKVMESDQQGELPESEESGPWGKLVQILGHEGDTQSLKDWPPDSLLSMLPSTCDGLFSVVESRANPDVVKALEMPFSVTKRLLVKGDYLQLFSMVLLPWVSDSMEILKQGKVTEGKVALSRHVVRFSAHLGVLLKVLNWDEPRHGKRSPLDLTIEAYSLCLITSGKYQLLPHHICLIDEGYQQMVLRDVLIHMAEESDDVKKNWVLDAGRWFEWAAGRDYGQHELPHESVAPFRRLVILHSLQSQKSPSCSPGNRVEAAKWMFFCRPDSLYAQPSEEELGTVLNTLRDFAVTGAWCTEYAIQLVDNIQGSIYYAQILNHDADSARQNVAQNLQSELKLLANFLHVENALQEWLVHVDDFGLETRSGKVFVCGVSWPPEVERRNGAEPNLPIAGHILQRLHDLYEEGLQLMTSDYQKMLAAPWIKDDARENMEDDEVQIVVRYCHDGSDSSKYHLYSEDQMELADQSALDWSVVMREDHGIDVQHECRDGFIILQATAQRQDVDVLVSRICLLAKGEIEEMGPISVFNITGSHQIILAAVSQQVCLGRFFIEVAKVQELLWLLGDGLKGKLTVVEDVAADMFFMKCLSIKECKTLLRREERTLKNQHVKSVF